MSSRYFILSLIILIGCSTPVSDSTRQKNALSLSKSPYLLQHSTNPVSWNEWKPKVLKQAKEDQKPIILSIGYSSCHWCHVMERETFEDTSVANLMNKHFVNIKVD